MNAFYNPILVGKLFDLAGHPATPDHEALSAARKAYAHCSSRSTTPGDIVRLVSDDTAKDIWTFPVGKLFDQIADLQIALDRAETQIAPQNELIAELRRSAAADGSTIHELKAQIITLNDALMREKTAAEAARTVANAQARVETVQSVPTGAPPRVWAEHVVRPKKSPPKAGMRSAAKKTRSDVRRSSRTEAEDVEPNTAEYASGASRPWTVIEKARLAVLACLGRARSSIARTLTREFGRPIPTSCVLNMLRQRWLAPDYGMMC